VMSSDPYALYAGGAPDGLHMVTWSGATGMPPRAGARATRRAAPSRRVSLALEAIPPKGSGMGVRDGLAATGAPAGRRCAPRTDGSWPRPAVFLDQFVQPPAGPGD